MSRLVKPKDVGLSFGEWWPGQWEAVEEIKEAFKTYDIVFFLGGTGIGKSGISVAVARSGEFRNATILAHTISLEEQYGATLGGQEVGRGKRWHPCYRGIEPEKCQEQELNCPQSCEYKKHVERLYEQKLRVMNYPQFYAMNATKQRFSSELVVCDEAHGLEDTLAGFATFMTKGKYTPTWGSEYRHLLFNSGKKFLLMSASMIPSLVAQTVGIKPEEYTIVEAHNPLDPDRSPVYVKPVGYVTQKTPHTERLIQRIREQMDKNPLSGVIHTASDRQTEEILEGLDELDEGRGSKGNRYRSRLLWPKGRDRAETFQTFKNTQGSVLISASSYEGQDFPDDECRWQIICKVPYASLGDTRVRMRREERPDIYQLEALQKVQQACGRGMRHPDDWCINTILDGTVLGLYKKYGHMLSEQFRSSWKGKV